jgi:signal transduction histidine kinase/CheY-like chemotaxis protein
VVALKWEGARTHCLVMTDLTEQRRESAAIAAERAQMQARLLLADRMSSLGTLAAGVAHEINNPLAYVMTSLDLLNSRLQHPLGAGEEKDRERTDWLRRQVARAHEGVERVRLIVRDLKAFSRADDETIGVVDPRRALDTAVALASNEIRHRALLLKDYDALPPVSANEARLRQMFLNLLLNAIQAIAPGAAAENEIRISGHTDCEGRAVIEVRDTGSGIAAAHLAFVFDPFFTTKPLNEGTGLGLSLCHSIVASLDGKITVQSELGKGSTFRVVLPGVARATSTGAPVLAAAPPMFKKRGRLLVIDDEPDICLALEEALQEQHDVLALTEAHEALERLAAGQRFDLILCDVRMPRMTGVAFHARLSARDPAQASRVILMSGDFSRRPGDPEVVLPGPVLEKPFGIERVLSLLHEAMARGEGFRNRHPQRAVFHARSANFCWFREPGPRQGTTQNDAVRDRVGQLLGNRPQRRGGTFSGRWGVGDRDLIAEGFKPASEPTCAFGRVASIEEVHAKVLPGRAVTQHEPGRHAHRGGHRDRRLVPASSRDVPACDTIAVGTALDP